MVSFIFLSNACANPKKLCSDIHAEIQQYEWTDLYDHKNTYESSCSDIFVFLPHLLNTGNFTDSLTTNSHDLFAGMVEDGFIPGYGGVYEKGIPVKNRQCFEDCYSATIEFLRTTHKEYIELGIIQKKK